MTRRSTDWLFKPLMPSRPLSSRRAWLGVLIFVGFGVYTLIDGRYWWALIYLAATIVAVAIALVRRAHGR